MNKEIVLPPLKEDFVLNENQQAILDRFKEELEHRIRMNVSFKVWKENLLAYPSINPDLIYFEIRVGNWRREQVISSMEMEVGIGGSFFYFCRRIVDQTMADLLRIGASRC